MNNNRYYTENYNEKSYQSHGIKYEYHSKGIKSHRYGIPKPVRHIQLTNSNEGNFSKTTPFQRGNFIMQTNPNQNYFPPDSHIRVYNIKFNNNPYQPNLLVESYPQTDRLNFNNEIIYHRKSSKEIKNNNNGNIYQRKISKDNIHNNSNHSFQFVKQNIYNNININSNNQTIERNINNDYNDYNDIQTYEKQPIDNYKNRNKIKCGYLIIRDRTPNAGRRRLLSHNYSSKILYRECNFNPEPEDKSFTKEINGNDNGSIFINHKMIEVKQKYFQNNNNKRAPNNRSTHTIKYTNKKKSEIPLPQKGNNTKNTHTSKKKNIPQEINSYFFQRRIKYSDREKYIKAALFIQTAYRNAKKGKLKMNFVKKYVKFFKAINNLQSLFENESRYWNYFKEKCLLYIKNNLSKPTVHPKTYIQKNTKLNGGERINRYEYNMYNEEKNQNLYVNKKIIRSQSRDIINVERLLKEKEDLEKRLHDIMKENTMLKEQNLNHKDLISKNIALNEKLEKNQKKTRELEMENEKYLNEFSKTKDRYSKIEGEVADVNMKLKITYLKFIVSKKETKIQNIMKKHLKKFKEIAQKLKLFEEIQKQKEMKNQDNINVQKSLEKKKEEELKMNKRNKILMELLFNKEKERIRLMHSCFSQFYYKGLINQYKFRKSIMIGQLHKDDAKNDNSEMKRKEEEKKREEEEKIKKEEEEKKRKEEEERIKKEEEEKKRKEEEEKKRKEEEEKKKEDEKKIEQTKKMNKLNMERRKKLKKLLRDEKKQQLDIKREYFKKYHFRVFFFASHIMKKKSLKDQDNLSNNDNNEENQNEEEIKIKRKEEEEKQQKEREEFINNRQKKLQTIFFKKDRSNIIKQKNILQRWNLTAKLISLGPKKKLRGRSRKGTINKKRKTDAMNDEEKIKKLKILKNSCR